MTILGDKRAAMILYLPNRPLMPESDLVSVPELIELNGNHWRKILTIFAKINAKNGDWKEYRDQQLLKHNECICFGDVLMEDDVEAKGLALKNIDNSRLNIKLHVIAGKESWARVCKIDSPESQGFIAIDHNSKIWMKDNILLTPYFDYRQFSNALIDSLTKYLADEKWF
jgi:hypothetical protein